MDEETVYLPWRETEVVVSGPRAEAAMLSYFAEEHKILEERLQKAKAGDV